MQSGSSIHATQLPPPHFGAADVEQSLLVAQLPVLTEGGRFVRDEQTPPPEVVTPGTQVESVQSSLVVHGYQHLIVSVKQLSELEEQYRVLALQSVPVGFGAAQNPELQLWFLKPIAVQSGVFKHSTQYCGVAVRQIFAVGNEAQSL